MKIIGVDNFDRKTTSDIFVASVPNNKIAERIVELLNDTEPEDTSWFFKVVPDDYKLFVFEP